VPAEESISSHWELQASREGLLARCRRIVADRRVGAVICELNNP
jgi:hypothetical protein